MLESAKKTGVLDTAALEQSPGYNTEALKAKGGPLVMIECVERIPCNPCETVCPSGAITVGDNITNLPVVLPEKCNGCGLCIAVCPGLAIFVVDLHHKPGLAAISFAYEFLPVPEKGDPISATDREGNVVCSGVVEKIVAVKNYDMTRVITISVPKEHAHTVRGIQPVKEACKDAAQK